jgi:hypothetical protein
MSSWSDENIQAIVSAIKDDKLVVFFGSGISASSGLPDWDGLVEGLLKTIADPAVYAKNLMNGIRWCGKDTPLELFEYLYTADRPSFEDKFTKLFPKDINYYKATEEAKLLAKLKIKRFVTTNYDFCFEKSFNVENKNYNLKEFDNKTINIDEFNMLQTPCIFHIHGRADHPINDLILTNSQYDKAYSNDSPISLFLQHLFSEYLVLFIGFGFKDADIKRILSRHNAYSDSPAKYTHIGILGHRSYKYKKDSLHQYARKLWNIEMVFYKITGESKKTSHSQLRKLLIKLHTGINSSFAARKSEFAYDSDSASMAEPPNLLNDGV